MSALQQKLKDSCGYYFVEKSKQPSLIQKLKRQESNLHFLNYKEVQNWDTDALVEYVESIRNTPVKKDDELKELQKRGLASSGAPFDFLSERYL